MDDFDRGRGREPTQAPSLTTGRRRTTSEAAEPGRGSGRPVGMTVERILGRVDGRCAGSTVVVTGGVHGNEPAGVEALWRVLGRLDPARLRGRFVAVAGNRQALGRGRRFLERDLNRGWTPEALGALEGADPARLGAEAAEQAELLGVFRHLIGEAAAPVVFLDLHTMSGPGAPFVCMADVLRNRPFAFALGAPVILGLEEVIEGSMLGWLVDRGHVGIAVEGGQHDDAAAVDRLEAAIWETLVQAGSIDRTALPKPVPLPEAVLATADLPEVMEIRHRHVCREDDGFEMVPGFTNFQPVEKGQRLASDNRGAIRSPLSGLLLLPRYQGAGEDGFFIARAVRKRWLSVSARVRKLGLERALGGLPGISQDPEEPDRYLVDPRWAARPVIDVFHLLGFRRVRPEGPALAFSRRKPD